MKLAQVIYQQGDHRWLAIARDPSRPNFLIDTNEYLIVKGDHALLADPGGMEVFPQVFAAISQQFDPRNIQTLFASHQDPDIISSLALWLDFSPQLKCYVSWLWGGFIPHFGGDNQTLVNIPDQGMTITLGSLELQAIPAHYLHSSGNFNLYDAQARILFSGDIGAALLPPEQNGLFVEDFDSHIQYAEGFHRRWMGSDAAKLDWCERVSQLPIDMLCPQHGAIFRGADVERFINWFAELPVGSGIAPSC
jgi:flavorubredoxin